MAVLHPRHPPRDPQQLEALVPLLPAGSLLLGDGYYGSAVFLRLTQGIACDKLLRLPKNRVLYGPLPPRPPKPGPGQPRLDGAKWDCKDPTTQTTPDATYAGQDAQGHALEVCCWHNLHFQKARSVTVSVRRVTRAVATDTKRDPKVSWFVFVGETLPALEIITEVYARRYSLEHGFRVDKPDLLWEQAHLRTPEAFQNWTDVVACVRNQLVLCRTWAGSRRSWERKSVLPPPSQVRRGLGGILGELGTPARPSQPRGYSPGRQLGDKVKKATRYKVVYKAKESPHTNPAVI